jgi:hypothetical protein
MKNDEPRRHHYVPQWYQGSFADTDGRLWLYDRKMQRYKKVHPRYICCEKDLYTIDPEGRQDQRIERQYLNLIDGEGATALRRLARTGRLDYEWTESFSIFIAVLITRTPAFRTMLTQMYKSTGEEVMRLMTTDAERARDQLEQYRRATGDVAESVAAESMVEAVRGGHLRVNVTERPFLEHMFKHAQFLARWLASFEWQILIAPADGGFIISDYPFVVVPSADRPELAGLGLPGTVKYFPLTRRLCLKMGKQDFGFSHLQISKEEVRIINQNVAVNSERFIMGPTARQLRHVIARSGTESLDSNPRTTLSIVQNDNGGSLFRTTFWPIRKYFYSKT